VPYWVSGTGDDVNPCSRTAPCATFNGALNKEATSGAAILALDSGEFGGATASIPGAVTITQAVTINGAGSVAGVDPQSASDAIDINAPGDTVVLENLILNGEGIGLDGIKVSAASAVRLVNVTISGFTGSGVEFGPSASATKLFVQGSSITGNADAGVLIDPPAAGSATVELSNDEIDGNGCGVSASAAGCDSSGASSVLGTVALTGTSLSVTGNAAGGVLSSGSGASLALGGAIITGNAVGLGSVSGGQIVSLGDNLLYGNGSDGAFTSHVDTFSGAPGPTGPTGDDADTTGGPSAHVRTPTLQRVQCNATSSRSTFTCSATMSAAAIDMGAARRAQATLSRAGATVARGTIRLSAGRARLTWRAHHRRLATGSYTLTLRLGRKVITRQTIRMGARNG
jgi:hypothetical protein